MYRVFLPFLLTFCSTVAASVDIAPVWSAHPVGFQLMTHGDRQFVAFYDADRHMVVGVRALGSTKWQLVRLPSELGWDSHNSVTFAIDRQGYIHVAGNMHSAPLIYFRTTKPLDIGTFERIPRMIGRNEDRCTYPQFLNGPSGELIFTYRDGRSGAGDQIYNVYDAKSRSWQRLIDQPLTDGQGKMNAYLVGPTVGPDGHFHLVWTWRDTPDCATNHDLSYARSRDLVHWETSAGQPLALPIRIENAEIIDRVPVHGGMINGNTKIGFDAQDRVVVTYHKFDARGFTQIFNARREAGGWRVYQTTDWHYRWDFSGGGSIPFEVHTGSIHVGDGGLLLEYWHKQYGSAQLRLDERTLKPLTQLPAPHIWPAEFSKPESHFPGMQVHLSGDTGEPPAGMRYVLRWEALAANRDRPRQPPLPPPSMLRVYEIRSE